MYKTLFTILIILSASLSLFAQSPSTKKKNRDISLIENKILDTIWRLSEVKHREAYVRKQTKDKRHLVCTIWEKPTKSEPYYWVKVMEDNSGAYTTHFNFFVYPKTLVIKYFDTMNDRVIYLNTWRKK